MSKRPIRGELSFTAHKRQAITPEDEGPLPSSSSFSSLAHQASSLSTSKIPMHLIADLILPFVADRVTWNSVCSASKELCLTGRKMTPPWPNKAFNLGRNTHVRYLAFSPSGSQLAFFFNNHDTGQCAAHVWDRWGKETLLEGHTQCTCCMEHSLDGEHLASGSVDRSIRIWRTESFHSTSSKPHIERPTRTPKQADIILVGIRFHSTALLSFSRTDSNLLASGGWNGEIKLWNIREQACVHTFDSGGLIRCLFFAGGADIACLAVAGAMSVIRIWRAEGSSDFASETMGEADQGGTGIDHAAFAPSGYFVATRFAARTEDESALALYEIETMTKTQSVVMPGFIATCFAVSPDSKQLVFGDHKGRIQLLQTDDFSIQRDQDATGEAEAACSVAFDPTCRVLAIGCREGRLELRSLQMSTQRSAIYL